MEQLRQLSGLSNTGVFSNLPLRFDPVGLTEPSQFSLGKHNISRLVVGQESLLCLCRQT
jgi:hypothetical protein